MSTILVQLFRNRCPVDTPPPAQLGVETLRRKEESRAARETEVDVWLGVCVALGGTLLELKVRYIFLQIGVPVRCFARLLPDAGEVVGGRP